ncbi:MAG: RtcB family protein, partial [Gammaproteobacteria bacterium]|nr:RtcB family protein [Gammaproteobacteria bacterium]
MDINRLEKVSAYQWRIEATQGMHVPAIIYASEELIRDMDDKVYDQVTNVARLPGIINASYAMPDAHWGYGFPIGGVAAFDADQGGVISAGGVGFDISCGVRTLHTGLTAEQVMQHQQQIANVLYKNIPVGVGSTGTLHLNKKEMDAMLTGGARWAVNRGLGNNDDLQYIEEHGCMPDAMPEQISEHARERQKNEMGTLGSGNHYLEVQQVTKIYDADIARDYGIKLNDIKISIHCGSRGLGHQIGTDYLKAMLLSAKDHGIKLPDRELACAPIHSAMGQRYLGAMRGAINCALANREIITHLTRQSMKNIFPDIELDLLFDVSHNTCKLERHAVKGEMKSLYVHRKGATRAYGPGHSSLPAKFYNTGQPVLIGGTMGTASYILSGTETSMHEAFGSACHGAGRHMSRRQASRLWNGSSVMHQLADKGIMIRSPSMRGIAEEAPGAYKDISAVVNAADHAGLAHRVARLE